jgi:hypothetical protein
MPIPTHGTRHCARSVEGSQKPAVLYPTRFGQLGWWGLTVRTWLLHRSRRQCYVCIDVWLGEQKAEDIRRHK